MFALYQSDSKGWVLAVFEGRSLRFSQSEKSDVCPTAKLLSDACVAFGSISVNTEMNKKSYKRVFGVFVQHKARCASGTYFSLPPQAQRKVIKRNAISLGLLPKTHLRNF